MENNSDKSTASGYFKKAVYVFFALSALWAIISLFKRPTAALFDLLNDAKITNAYRPGSATAPLYFMQNTVHKSAEYVIKDLFLSDVSGMIYNLASYKGLFVFKTLLCAFFIFLAVKYIHPATGFLKKILFMSIILISSQGMFMDINYVSSAIILLIILKLYAFVDVSDCNKLMFQLSFIVYAVFLTFLDARFFIIALMIYVFGSYPVSRLIRGVSLAPVLTLIVAIILSCAGPYRYKAPFYSLYSIKAWLYDSRHTPFTPSSILSLQGIFLFFVIICVMILIKYSTDDHSLYSKILISFMGCILLFVSKELLWLSVLLCYPLLNDFFLLLEGIYPESEIFKSVQKGNEDKKKVPGKHVRNIIFCLLPAAAYACFLIFRFDTFYLDDSVYMPSAGVTHVVSNGTSPRVLTDAKTGSFVSFSGCDVYFDDRYELYMRPLNNSRNILSEYIEFETNPDVYTEELQSIYDFDYALLSSDSYPYMYLKGSPLYTEVFAGNGYSVFKMKK